MSSNDSPSSSTRQPPVGIDLGTTFSVVSYIDSSHRPVTILNRSGDLLTPSSLLFDDDGVVIGKEALKSSVISPELYVDCFKREMGGFAYHAKIRDIDVPPEILSAFVLERLRRDAERRIGPISNVVITVPAFFDETRRQATQDAGHLAGLNVLDIINEPTAAAIAFGYDRGFFNISEVDELLDHLRVLVYDLGGGTFDVTILEIHGTRFRALATDGDVRLGGKDFDERLVNHLAEKFLATHGVDPRSDPQDAAQLWIDAQEAKHSLSERAKTTVVCFHAGIRMRIEITRDEFEDLTRDLLERTETTTSLVAKQAGIDWSEIDRVLLVGGSSRMPMVDTMLEQLTGKEPDHSQSPDEVVAHGAALYAEMLMQRAESGQSRCELINVNSHSLGVVGIHKRTGQKTNAVLIPKNSPLPCHAVRIFKTARANQRSVRVPVVEGESHRPEDCIHLGECIVRGLPNGLPKGTPIEVEYRYAANGRISVNARVPSVRQSAHVNIQRNQTRDLGDLETWDHRLRGLPVSDGFATPTPTSKGPLDMSDHSAIVKRLDALYIKTGRAAIEMTLPAKLHRTQQGALTAVSAVEQAKKSLTQAEQAKAAAASAAESIQQGAIVSQAQTELKQSRQRADFAHLVLGRDCFDLDIHPKGCEKAISEIAKLRKHLDQ